MGLFFKKKPPSRKSSEPRIEKRTFLQKYPIEIHRTPRRRQTSLVVEPRGQILIKCAVGTSDKDLASLVASHEEWLKSHLKRALEYQQKFPLKKFIEGESYPLRGTERALKILLAQGRKWRVESGADRLLVYVPRDFKTRFSTPSELRASGLSEIKGYYKRLGTQVLTERMTHWSKISGLVPTKLSFRSQKTLWGSCSSQGRISLNWRMVAFPEIIYDYILVHELCHLVHQDHSPRFWALVAQLVPDYKRRRHWLRRHQNTVDFLSK